MVPHISRLNPPLASARAAFNALRSAACEGSPLHASLSLSPALAAPIATHETITTTARVVEQSFPIRMVVPPARMSLRICLRGPMQMSGRAGMAEGNLRKNYAGREGMSIELIPASRKEFTDFLVNGQHGYAAAHLNRRANLAFGPSMSSSQLGAVVLPLAILIVTAHILGYFFTRLRQPR